jgi:hypothetical protein
LHLLQELVGLRHSLFTFASESNGV